MTNVDPPDWAVTVYRGARSQPIATPTPNGPSQSQMDVFVNWRQNLAGKDGLAAGDVPVAGSAVSGTVQTNNIGIAPATSVAIKDTNMVVSQDFPNASTVVSVGSWSWDGTDGRLTKGCARVDCNGTQDDLLSNEIPVVVGENVSVTCWVKWADLSYTGTDPIVLGVEKYRKGRDPDTGGTVYMDVGGADVETLESPAASSSVWVKLTGTYTVPARVDQLRFRFRAAPTITAGYVKWDEAVFQKNDLIPDEAVPGIGSSIDNVVNNLQGQPGTGYTQSDAAAAYQNTASALTSANARIAVIDATGGTGSVAADDFSWTGEIIASANWDGYYTLTSSLGTYNANGNDAVWTEPASLSNVQQVAVFSWESSGATSSTDYQKINIILNGAIGNGASAGVYGSVYLIGRMSSDRNTYVRLQINGDGTAGVYKIINGTSTLIGATVSTGTVGTGTSIDFLIGNKDATELGQFRAYLNGLLILDVTDGSPITGATYRKWGWGGHMAYQPSYPVPIPYTLNGYYWYGNNWVNPPAVNQWIAQDQQ